MRKNKTELATEVVFLDGEAAEPYLAMLEKDGHGWTLRQMSNDFSHLPPKLAHEPWGAPADTYIEQGDYVLYWNTGLGYIGLNRMADDFTLAYLEAALWASTDDDGDPLDQNYSFDDFAPEAIAQAAADCQEFQLKNGFSYNDPQYSDEEKGGHDFWLTRNGHGTGFWDRGLKNGEALAEAARAFGECHLYVGDDGKLYFS